MIGELIRFLIAAACGLFVLSLPLSKTDTGATLRRWAGACLVLAFLPALVGGLFFPAGASDAATTPSTASPATTAAGHVFSIIGCIAVLVLAAFIAYGILKLRSRFVSKAKPRDPWETFFNRGGGKRPFTMNPKAARSRNPYTFDDEDDD